VGGIGLFASAKSWYRNSWTRWTAMTPISQSCRTITTGKFAAWRTGRWDELIETVFVEHDYPSAQGSAGHFAGR
jgi:hypothetical protein